MIYEGVNFNEEAIKGMPLDTFLAQNEPYLWPGKDKKARRKMLVEVYEMVNPKEDKPEEK